MSELCVQKNKRKERKKLGWCLCLILFLYIVCIDSFSLRGFLLLPGTNICYQERTNWKIGKPARLLRDLGVRLGVKLAIVILFVSCCNFILCFLSLPLPQRSILYQERIRKGLDLLFVGWVAWVYTSKPPKAWEWSFPAFKHYLPPSHPPWHSSRWWAPGAGGIPPAGW